MTLVDRLFCLETAISTGKTRAYRFGKFRVFSVADVIRIVLERYARRFGVVTSTQAPALHQRLAKKYLGSEFRNCEHALEKDIHPLTNTVYPTKVRRQRVFLAMECSQKNSEAEKNCIHEGRRYVPVKYFSEARNTPNKRRISRQRAEWRRDELNLAQCKKIIHNIKEIYRENT